MPFTLTMPKLSPTMNGGVITKWRKREGEHVAEGEVVMEIATDKATVEHAVLDGGWLRKILIPEGGEAMVNQGIAIFSESKDESIDDYKPEGVVEKKKEPQRPTEEQKKEEQPTSFQMGMQLSAFALEAPMQEEVPISSIDKKGRVKASPLAKKLAKEKKLDLTTVQGSGPKGLVTSKDLSLAQEDARAIFGSKKRREVASGSYIEEVLSPMRKKNS